MRCKILILALIIISLGQTSCLLDRCRYNIEYWHNQAQSDFEAFKEVQYELSTFGYTKDSAALDLFIKSWDDNAFCVGGSFSFENKPKLDRWRKRYPDGFISYRNGEIMVQLYNCQSYNEYTAYLYSNHPNRSNFNAGVEFVDSLVLEDNWHYLVIKCRGCRD